MRVQPLFPCVALSTQDKVAGFARICGLDDFLVDVEADGNSWPHSLSDKRGRLRRSDAFRSSWYAKRDACLRHWGGIARRFHAEMRTRFEAGTLPPPRGLLVN